MNNLKLYDERMAKSLVDKLFFLPYVTGTHTFVDYGCADGTLLSFIKNQNTTSICIGFDNVQDQLEIARTRKNNVLYFDNWGSIKSFIHRKDATLVLSSVIHEIYSYGSENDISVFWDRVFSSGFKHIAIRDMSITEENANQNIELTDITKIRSKIEYSSLLNSFENRWGKIDKGINYLHWLLKYHYGDNWLRENSENYLPIMQEKLKALIPNTYSIEMQDYYTLPYIRSKALETFGITMKMPSHIKMLLTAKNA
jgi:hypothetical protein